MEKEKNAIISVKEIENGFKALLMTVSLKDGSVVSCEIKLNPYNKKGLSKLYYKITQNI